MTETNEQISTPERRSPPVSLTQVAGVIALAAAMWQAVETGERDDLVSGLGLQLLLVAAAAVLAITGRVVPGASFLLGVTFPLVLLYWAVLPVIAQYNESPGTSYWALMVMLTAVVVMTALQTGRPVLTRLAAGPLPLAAASLGLAFAIGHYFVLRDFRSLGEPLPELLNVIITLLVVAPLIWGLGLGQPQRRSLLLGWVVSQGIWWVELLDTVDELSGDGRWVLLLCIPTALLTIACALRDDAPEVGPVETAFDSA